MARRKTAEREIHLISQLEAMKVEECRRAARIIGIRMPSGAKKDVLCKTLATSLIADADAVLDGLTVFEIRRLIEIIEAGGSRRYPPYMENVFSLSLMHIADAEFVEKVDEGGGMESLITIPQELLQAFIPIANRMLGEKEQEGVEELEQAAAGILAIYGTMPFSLLIEKMSSLFPDYSEGRLKLSLQRKYLFKSRSPKWDANTVYAASAFIGADTVGVFFDRHLFQLPVEYKDLPDKETVMRFGQMPIPDICTPGAVELHQEYRETFGEEEGDWSFTGAWMDAQQMPLRNMTERILQELCVEEEDITVELVDTIKRFLNHIPHWSMYGYSVSDHARRVYGNGDQADRRIEQEYHRSDSSHQKKDSAYSLLDLSADHPYWNGQKVGRNDPCPCGSGLKFKKCHGKM